MPVELSLKGKVVKANLHSRLASRILKPILDFTAYQPDELYQQVLNHDFTKYINPTQSISIDASVKECKMQDQRFVAMKIKDAIVDQFRDKFGVRPDVDNNNPALRIHVKAYKNLFSFSGRHFRGQFVPTGLSHEFVEAPLKEI